MSTAGEIIYKAFAPTLKIVICIGIGYAITKKGMFPPAGAKGVSILSLNVGLPALIFSSMVTAFNDDNIAAFGSLVPVAILYQCLGALMALFISEVFYVPNDFKWGILVAGATSNWGNLPIAVVQTMAAGEPFNGTTDVQLGVAYISIFVFIMNTSFFPLGIHKLCALDFREENLAKAAPLPFKARWADRMKRIRGSFQSKSKKEDEDMKAKRSSGQATSSEQDNSTAVSDRGETRGYEEHKISEDQGESGEEIAELKKRVQKYGGGSVPYRKTSRASSFTSMLETTRPIPSTAPLDAPDASASCGIAGPSFTVSPPPHTSPTLNPATTDPSRALSPGSANANASNTLIPMCSNHGQAYTFHQPLTPVPSIHKPTVFQRVKGILKNFLMPVTMAICIALPCSLVLPLKALFIQVDGWTGTKMPNAPDARPPLSFILDTAEFIGGISIPAALILLGAGFARIKPPSNWRELPIGAIIALTTAKMILLPVFGIFFVQALRDKTSLYPPPDKMRTFVAILLSGTPTSVNQLVVTQLYNPAGTAHTLAMFLMVQYALMPILSTAIAALALYVAQ